MNWRNVFINFQDNLRNFIYAFEKYSKNGFEYLKKVRQQKADQKNRQAFLDQHKEKIKSMPKPEIKKVRKQETEKREYKVKDFVVYPKHGVGQIIEFKKKIKRNRFFILSVKLFPKNLKQ